MSQQNDITKLRDALFATLDALRDTDRPMDVDRAKAINDTAQTIINSAKVEVEFMKVTGGKGSGFVPSTDVVAHLPGVTVRRHELKG